MNDFDVVNFVCTRKDVEPEDILKENSEKKDRQIYMFSIDDAAVESYFYFKDKECVEVHYYLDDIYQQFSNKIEDKEKFNESLISILEIPSAEVRTGNGGGIFLLIRGRDLMSNSDGTMNRVLYTSANVLICLACLLLDINESNIHNHDYKGYCAYLQSLYYVSKQKETTKFFIIAGVLLVVGIVMLFIQIFIGLILLVAGLGVGAYGLFKYSSLKKLAQNIIHGVK